MLEAGCAWCLWINKDSIQRLRHPRLYPYRDCGMMGPNCCDAVTTGHETSFGSFGNPPNDKGAYGAAVECVALMGDCNRIGSAVAGYLSDSHHPYPDVVAFACQISAWEGRLTSTRTGNYFGTFGTLGLDQQTGTDLESSGFVPDVDLTGRGDGCHSPRGWWFVGVARPT